jgi:hypothetical protein
MNNTVKRILTPAILLGCTVAVATLTQSPAQAGGYSNYSGSDRPYFDRDRSNHDDNANGTLRWRGDVDDTTIVYIHGQDVSSDTINGKQACNIRTHLDGWLPVARRSFVTVQYEGRGSVQVVQQPRADNNFTAAVRIYDPQSGASRYNLLVNWHAVSWGDRSGR